MIVKSLFSKILLPSLFFEVDLTLALDDFRSLPEGSWTGNWGAYAAINLKAFFSQCVAGQLAGSYGLYDWAGRAFAPFGNADSLQQQGFITVALSRETLSHRGQ